MPTCILCGISFKNCVIVDSIKRNVSKRCYCVRCLPLKSSRKSSLVNWNEVQLLYDTGYTWRGIAKHFHIYDDMIIQAIKDGKFRSRTKSEALILASKRQQHLHSAETKEKISKIRIAYLQNHPDKVPYKLNHYSKGPSYPEQYFNTVLLNCSLDFERYVQVSLYNLDFVFRNQMVDLEVDGDQHYLDRRIVQSNKRRDNYLQSHGWRVIRVRWSDFKKLSDMSRYTFVDNLVKEITK